MEDSERDCVEDSVGDTVNVGDGEKLADSVSDCEDVTEVEGLAVADIVLEELSDSVAEFERLSDFDVESDDERVTEGEMVGDSDADCVGDSEGEPVNVDDGEKLADGVTDREGVLEAEEDEEQPTKMAFEGKLEGSRFESMNPDVANFVVGTE